MTFYLLIYWPQFSLGMDESPSPQEKSSTAMSLRADAIPLVQHRQRSFVRPSTANS
ncbi:unknown protein [Microcystis aeruginosa NIES-843]|uniref:Uncharacterized protein n=1 Tax=Microcystis aeruginosa (strain NIES-843 / IAM M-2473) TaxID=449447 RepID=B0JU19_MICAN|nr:unknown protein [Microcystis aeruginosa NIES-843]